VFSAILLLALPLRAAENEVFQFFEEERVVSGSLIPQTRAHAPASVHVITADDIRASGIVNLWDALRPVPGVDVMSPRTSHGEVAIRGLNKASNNRTLVLLDGRTVLNGFFDYVDWEAIPVMIEEIDRIEVVEGAASSLYGSNAAQGVVNIITKRAEAIDGGAVAHTEGERGTHVTRGMIGHAIGRFSYRLGLGWRSFERYEDASRLASEVGKAHGLVEYAFSDRSRVSISAGASNHNVQLAGGAYDDGLTSFLQADLTLPATRGRFFWNRGRTVLEPNVLHPALDYDTYDASLEREFQLPFENLLVAGASYRRNRAASPQVFGVGTRSQDLASLFFEDGWTISQRWRAWAGGRLDRHPLAGWFFSPRASLVFTPLEGQTLRLSASRAFRNPTLVENYSDFRIVTAAIDARAGGAPELGPERMSSAELGYEGTFGRLRAAASAFGWRLSEIVSGRTEVVSLGPPVQTRTVAINQGKTTAVGGETEVEWRPMASWSFFANYAYQSLEDELVSQGTALASPKHKVNWGARLVKSGWTGNLWAHWVDKTLWNVGTGAPVILAEAPAYLSLNLRLARRFSGAWRGLEAAVAAHNLGDSGHIEFSPAQAEPIKSRLSGTLSYRF
jgi:outer membrane receptor for ferrienterochelin and colicin